MDVEVGTKHKVDPKENMDISRTMETSVISKGLNKGKEGEEVTDAMETAPVNSEYLRDYSLDKFLLDNLREKEAQNSKYRRMLEFRSKLPAFKLREEIVSVLSKNQVVVISGETGCGKTTQVPQFILDAAILSGEGSTCRVVCTQPRRISAISVAERVAAERGEPCGAGLSTGYQIRLESKLPRTKGSIVYCTTGVLLRWMSSDPLLQKATHIILDEVHERDLQTDFLLIIVKDLLIRRPDVKVILMSATLNADMFSAYFGDCPTFHIPGNTYPVEEHYLEDILRMIPEFNPTQSQRSRPAWHRGYKRRFEEEKKWAETQEILSSITGKYPQSVIDRMSKLDMNDLNHDLAVSVVRHICLNKQEGAILVFLPGWDSISKVHDMMKSNPLFQSNGYLIIPLHSMMPSAYQQSVFERPPPGVRKIVLATNIAETSITIDDVVHVVDCGKVKQTMYDHESNLPILEAVWVSKAAAKQRAGRAGRVQAGHCFRLYSAWKHMNFEEFQPPEMLRTPLEELVLQLKMLKLGRAAEFLSKAMEPPNPRSVKNAIDQLQQLKALDMSEELTPLGHHLALLPVAPRLGKMILFGAMFSCLDPVLTMAAALGFKDPFVIPLNKVEEADEVRCRFAGDSQSDHICILNAYKGWEKAKSRGGWHETRSYCWDFFLSHQTLEMLSNMKKQFAELLHSIGFVGTPNPKDYHANFNSDNEKLLKAVLCAGLYPNVAKLVPKGPKRPPQLQTRQERKVEFHLKSVNSKRRSFTGRFFVYNTKIKSSSVFIHDSTLVPPFPLLFFGGLISSTRDAGQELICVDEWIQFRASNHITETVKELRCELDRLLQFKIENPRLDLYTPSKGKTPSSQLIKAIISLITTEESLPQPQDVY
jgi:ATP-dependent RNA helicase DHX36